MARRLEDLCRAAYKVTLDLPLPEDDHFAFMASCFLAKQLEHATAVLRLGEHPDGWLVARCMLEGMWQLKWAALERDTRPERWRRFAHVHDWRLLRERDEQGVFTDEPTRERIHASIKEHGEQFLSKRSRDEIAEGKVPAEPYEKTWYGVQIRQIAEKVGDLDLYLTAYNDFSERQHWDVAGVARGIRVEGTSITYNASSPSALVIATAIAFQCLAMSALLIDSTFDRGFREVLLKIVQAHIQDGHSYGVKVAT